MLSAVKVVLLIGFFLGLLAVGYCQFGMGRMGFEPLPFVRPCAERAVQAICRMQPNRNLPSSNINGMLVFTQRANCYGHFALQIKVRISDMVGDGNWTYHGLHVHESGDMRNSCDSMGPHFNPYRTTHGSQTDPAYRRHVGDLGNVVKDPYGHVQGAIFDNLASLVGPVSIINRGVVLHEFEDDLGRGLNNESLRTGNAGRRLACCVVESI